MSLNVTLYGCHPASFLIDFAYLKPTMKVTNGDNVIVGFCDNHKYDLVNKHSNHIYLTMVIL